ncbi:MAG: DUF4394 domain-containing protein [Saprospiraceae bacterium]|uniref:DUF4394 domain-containing protein n=1 Tax=Candidatus Opimibacter skivensis TaxID=2982028 RepID=A0A9D7XVU4_9BACT|nr:DUF4394 domain-containing protein [Candidatus Opimibacter skivensis]
MRHDFNLLLRGMALYAAILFFAGCSQDESIKPKDDLAIGTRGLTGPGTGGGAGPKYVYGLTDQNQLMLLKPGPPVTTVSMVTLTGFTKGDRMLAIDFRPANGLMYGVSDANLIYIIDPATGTVKPISRSPFNPGIKGSTVGFDFDPKNDQIRLVTDADLNMRIDPNFGTVIIVDTDINPSFFDMNAIAYGYNFATRTYPLFDIDISRGYLTRQNPENAGAINPVGPLNMVIIGEGGFDIPGNSNSTIGLAVLTGHSLIPGNTTGDNLSNDACRLWEINLSSAKATYKGKLTRNVIGLAIP